MAYVGVEFSEGGARGGAVGLVHSSWLTPLKREVFWPPYKTSNLFRKALTTPEEPDQDNWNLYPVKRIFFECDDIDKANRKLRRCEETSDVRSSESEFGGKRKRSRLVKRKCASDCSSSEDESSLQSLLQRPPVLPELTKTPATATPGWRLLQPVSNSTNTSPYYCTPTTSQSISRDFTGNAICAAPPTRNSLPEETIRQNVTENSTVQSPLLSQGSGMIAVNKSSLETIFQEIRKLREEVKEVKVLLKQSRTSTVVGLPEDIPVQFPLKTVADLQILDEYLNEEEKNNYLACYLSSLGGTGTTAQVNRILRFLMENELATLYNFAGQRKEKQAFGNTQLKSTVVRAIQLKTPATTQAEIEAAIKVWLKHAKQRIEKKPH